MEKIINPFSIKEFCSLVELEPRQMQDIYINLKNNLKKKVEGVCNNYGFIKSVIKIIDYSENMINDENFSSNAEFKVKYQCYFGTIVIGDVMIAKVDNLTYNIDENFIVLKNDIIQFISDDNISENIITFEDKFRYKDDNTEVKQGDFLIVKIMNLDFKYGEKEILIIAKILGKATKKEIEDYYTEFKEEENVFDQLTTFEETTETIEDSEVDVTSKYIADI